MNVRQINHVLVSQGTEAAIAAATAADLGWVAKKIHLGEWETDRFEKKAPKRHFLHEVKDICKGKELVKVAAPDGALEQYVIRFEVSGRTCTEPLGRIPIAEARKHFFGKEMVVPPCPGYGKKTNVGDTGTKGKSAGASKTVTSNPKKAAKISRKQAARKD